MARTKDYARQVMNSTISLNKKILDVERTFGIGSSQYERYVNAITAALPVGSYNLSESGRIRVSKSKAAQASLKVGQLRGPKSLPTAKQSLTAGKRSMAKQRVRKEKESGEAITEKEVAEKAVFISDQEALEELAAKSYIEGLENEKGQLNYDSSIKEKMKERGSKSYAELKKLMEEGEKKRERRAKNREAARRYREKHRDEINARRREQRRQARARVSEDSEVYKDIP